MSAIGPIKALMTTTITFQIPNKNELHIKLADGSLLIYRRLFDGVFVAMHPQLDDLCFLFEPEPFQPCALCAFACYAGIDADSLDQDIAELTALLGHHGISQDHKDWTEEDIAMIRLAVY